MAAIGAGRGGADEAAAVVRDVHGQPSWILAGDDVEVAVTKLGGHMAPVTFDRRGRPFQPYHVTPWQDEKRESFPAAVLAPLRGDFFCLPFGGNGAAYHGERHVPHGETATAAWTFAGRSRAADGAETLTLTLDTKVRPGRVTKEVTLRPTMYCPRSFSFCAVPVLPPTKKPGASAREPEPCVTASRMMRRIVSLVRSLMMRVPSGIGVAGSWATKVGRTITPPLAMAETAVSTCKGVTAMPWP